MKIHTDVIWGLLIFGLCFFAVWKQDYTQAIFWYLILMNAEHRVSK